MVTADNDIATVVIGFVHALADYPLPSFPLLSSSSNHSGYGNRNHLSRNDDAEERREDGKKGTTRVERVNGFEYANRRFDRGREGGRRRREEIVYSQLLPFQPPATTRDQTFPSALVFESQGSADL